MAKGPTWRCKWGCGKEFASLTLLTAHEKYDCSRRKQKKAKAKAKSRRVMKNWKPRGKSRRKRKDGE